MNPSLRRLSARLTAAVALTTLVCAGASAIAAGADAMPPEGGATANTAASTPPAPALAKGVPLSARTPKGSLKARQVGPHAMPRITGKQTPATGEPGQSARMSGVPSKGKYAFLLALGTQSTFSAYGQAAPQGKAAASSAAKAQFRQVQADQSRVVSALPSGTSVLYKTHSVLAGVAVYTDVRNVGALRGISGVQAVYPIAPKTVSNSYAVPLQHAPQAWTAHGDLGVNSAVAVIDTGIDYTHANFGGPGTPAAYQTALAADTLPADPAQFPSTKIVGGTDLVGDAYNPDAVPPSPIPAPDPNPLDCAGHGSHVAGTVAGLGENADGSMYAGPYNMSTPFNTMRIGPGMAPAAKLISYKVFGCAGSTNVVAEAIDMATDPNQDGDPADHVQVINMSLGSDFGSPLDGDSVASNDASALGVSVVVASGNAGDFYDAGGSPGDAVRTIAVANSIDAQDQLDTLSVTTTATLPDPCCGAERSAAYDWATQPDLTGNVVALTQADNLDGCQALNATDAAAVAGKIAFLEWTDDDTLRRCGSASRAANVAAAGGTGSVFADDVETFAAGITGSATIPGVLITKSAGDAIRTALQTATVTVTGTTAASFRQTILPNDDKLNASSSRGVRGVGNVKPDVTAVGTGVFSTGMGTGNQGLSDTGTSMATPMVAGLAALVRSLNPGWNPEQVKADIMNTAGQDLFRGPNHGGAKYAPNRVGAGRIQADTALDNTVVAYEQNDPGAVSVSFGPVAAAAPVTLTRTVKVQNLGTTSATYSLAYQALTSVPGVTYLVSPTSLNVGVGETKTFTVSLVVNAAQLTKTIDPTMPRLQDQLPREYLADASGRVLLTSVDHPTLRVPVYAAPRPKARMAQPAALTLPHAALQQANMPLSGTGIGQGTGLAAIDSVAAGFELQATSGLLPTCTAVILTNCTHNGDERSADLKYFGATTDTTQVKALHLDPAVDGFVYFAVTAQGKWRDAGASSQEFDILIDTSGDNVPDAVLFNTRLNGQDIFVSELFDFNTGTVVDVEAINNRLGDLDTALYDSDTMVLPVAIAALPGVTGANARIRYGVLSFSNQAGRPVDHAGVDLTTGNLVNPMSINVFHPGLAVFGSFNINTNLLLYLDLPGTSLLTRREASAYFADRGLGALIVHFHNDVGAKAQVMQLKTRAAVTLKLSSVHIRLHGSVTGTVTVANDGALATGLVNVRVVGGGLLRTGRLTNGKAVVTFTPASRGTFRIRAEYAGDSHYLAGNSPIVTLLVS